MAKWKFWESNAPQPERQNGLSHYSFNKETGWNMNPKYDLSQPRINQYSGTAYLPFGEDNLYPNILLDMYHGSPFHAAILEFKTKAIIGDGLEITVKGNNLESDILRGKLEDKINRKFFRRFVQEYLIHERAYIKVLRKTEKGTDFEIIPSEYVRLSTNDPSKEVLVNDDWRRRRGNYQVLPIFDKYNTKDKIQVFAFQEEKPGFYGYAIPHYASAANWIWLDSEIAYFQKQNIENSINPSAIIKVYQDIQDKEKKDSYIRKLQDSFASAKNAGKVMVFFSNGKDLSPDVIISESNKLDRSFAASQENIIRNVAYAHLINPVLMGISTQGKLGASNELNEAYALFQITWLESVQDTIESYLNQLLKDCGWDATVKIKRKERFLPITENTVEQ